MFKKIKRLIKKILFAYRADSESYINYLRSKGAEIGERVVVYDPRDTIIDATRGYMIKIGDDVQITSGVKILTHGYDWSVLKGVYGNVLGSCGEVVIGNNCFIGMNSTILKGVHIGDNCVIGANSLVNKDFGPNLVIVGNPARAVMTIEEYYKKRLDAQLAEAEELYRCYVERMKKDPPLEEFDEFFWLFAKRDETIMTTGQRHKMNLIGNYERSLDEFLASNPLFDGYAAFLEYLHGKYNGK